MSVGAASGAGRGSSAGCRDACRRARATGANRPAADVPPPRRIVGFRRDECGDWVASLECGHGQHVRHDPPWRSRPWVVTPAGRASKLDETLPCRRCERGEPPDAAQDDAADSERGPTRHTLPAGSTVQPRRRSSSGSDATVTVPGTNELER